MATGVDGQSVSDHLQPRAMFDMELYGGGTIKHIMSLLGELEELKRPMGDKNPC